MIDIGCNLTHPKLFPKESDTEQFAHNCRHHGLRAIIAIGSNIQETRESITLAKRFPGLVFATAGIHPHYAAEMQEVEWDQLSHLLQQPEVVAIGEMGLDFYRNFSPKEIQIQVFEKQLTCNKSIQKPLYLHERDAFTEQLNILRKNRSCFTSGVAHCFTGNKDRLRAYLDLGFYIGITGWLCDERRSKELTEAIKFIPKDRLMTETDSPFLLPRTLRPKPKDGTNQPWFLAEVITKIAECRGETTPEVEVYSSQNATDLFGLKFSLADHLV